MDINATCGEASEALPALKKNARLRFATNVRQARKSKNLSQEALGELADLHPTYVGSVERGERNISIDNMEKIANALGMDITELLR